MLKRAIALVILAGLIVTCSAHAATPSTTVTVTWTNPATANRFTPSAPAQETDTIPSVAPYTVQVKGAGAFSDDEGVAYAGAAGAAFTYAPATLTAAGQYQLKAASPAGTYVFDSADAGKSVVISYTTVVNTYTEVPLTDLDHVTIYWQRCNTTLQPLTFFGPIAGSLVVPTTAAGAQMTQVVTVPLAKPICFEITATDTVGLTSDPSNVAIIASPVTTTLGQPVQLN